MEKQSWTHNLLSTLGAPFRWMRKLYNSLRSWTMRMPSKNTGLLTRIRNVIHKHPIISLTTLFLLSITLTYITGVWWLGGTLFLVSTLLFTGNSVFTGILRTSTVGFEIVLGLTMFFMATALVTPIPQLWLLYALAPAALIVGKALHNALAYSTFLVEARDVDISTEGA